MTTEDENRARITALNDFTLEAVEELQAEQKQLQEQLIRFESRTAGFLCGAVLSLALAVLFRQQP